MPLRVEVGQVSVDIYGVMARAFIRTLDAGQSDMVYAGDDTMVIVIARGHEATKLREYLAFNRALDMGSNNEARKDG